MSRRTRRTGGLQSTVERPATPAMRSVGGCASALRRCSAGPRRSPVSARPVIAVWPVSAGYSRRRPLPTISSGCANWWGPRRSHARNPPTHRKGQQNRCKDLLDEQRSATQARVTFDDPTFCFANSEFFSVLLECPHCASTLHRQSNTPKDGAQSLRARTLSLADEISIPFLHAPAPCSDVP